MKRLALSVIALLAMAASANAQSPSNCVVPYSAGAAPVVSVAAEGSHVLKAGPGCLLAAYVYNSGAAGFLMVLNSTTVPADGAVTPLECIPVAAASYQFINFAPQPPEYYSTGISIVVSTTGCFTKTVSSGAFFHALVQ